MADPDRPSQTMRMPDEFRLNLEQVEILRYGGDIVLRQAPVSAAVVFDLLASLPADFMGEGRGETLPQDREAL